MSEYQRKKFAVAALRAWLYRADNNDINRHKVLDRVVDLTADLNRMRQNGQTGPDISQDWTCAECELDGSYCEH